MFVELEAVEATVASTHLDRVVSACSTLKGSFPQTDSEVSAFCSADYAFFFEGCALTEELKVAVYGCECLVVDQLFVFLSLPAVCDPL